jgi:hypothetical protein
VRDKNTYATVIDNEGVNYRDIAEVMTEIGFKMNHSSARNYVLRVMRKFAEALVEQWDIDVPESSMDKIIKSPQFQQGICDVLQTIDAERISKTKRKERQ